jgi:hypothetical protein
MNWETGLVLGVILFVVALVILRSEPRTRRWIILILPVPTVILVYRWAKYEGTWSELAVGVAISAVALLVWWIVVGRRLPPPTGSTTRVWTKDDPF